MIERNEFIFLFSPCLAKVEFVKKIFFCMTPALIWSMTKTCKFSVAEIRARYLDPHYAEFCSDPPPECLFP